MAKLHKFTSIKTEDDENGESNSFENPSYVCDFDDKNEPRHAVQFSPQKKRCTPFNFAVAIFLLASGGLAVFLIVKFSQDNYDKDPTSRPRLGGFTTKPPVTGVNFDVSMRLSNQIWTDDFLNTSSKAYRNLSNSLTEQIKEGLNATETGPYLSGVFITGIRNGSVIIDVLIQLKYPSLASTLLSSLKNATDRAKSSGSLPLLADVDTESIYISLTLQTTTTVIKDTTSVMTSSSSSLTSSLPTQISSSSTTSSTTTPISSTTTSSSIPPPTSSLSTTSSTATTTQTSSSSTTIKSTTTPISSTTKSHISTPPKSSTPPPISSTTTSSTTNTPTSSSNSSSSTSSSSSSTTKSTSSLSTSTPSSSISTTVPTETMTTTTSSPSKNVTSVVSSTSLMTTASSTPAIYPCNNSDYLINTLIGQCFNSTQYDEAVKSTDDVKCKFVHTSMDCVLDHIQEKFNIICSEAEKNAAVQVFSGVVQSSLQINPEICFTPSTSLPPPMMTTTGIRMISPCNNTDYLSNTLTEQCLNTTQLSEVQHSTVDIKCNFILTSIDCVLGQIQKEFNITCSESDKHAAAKEFSSIVSGFLGINPEICLIPSTSSPPLILTTTAMKIISPCNNTDYLSNTLTEQCLNITQLSEVQHSTVDIKCNFVLTSIDCVLNRIQKEFNITCSESDKHAAAKEFSSIVSGFLGINPEMCLIPSTSSPPLIPTTTAVKIISPCNNTDYLSNTLTEQCLNTTQLSEVQHATDDIKCNFVLTSIDCVLNQIQKEFNITCSESDKHAAAKEFSSIVSGFLGINPGICLIPSTSSPPLILTTTAMKISISTSPLTPTSTLLADLTTNGTSTDKPTMPLTTSSSTKTAMFTSEKIPPSSTITTSLPETSKTLTPTILSTTGKTTISTPKLMTSTTLFSTTSKTAKLTETTATSSSSPTTTTTFSSSTITASEPLPTTTTVSKITTPLPIASSMTTKVESSTAKTTKITSLPPTWTSMLSPTTIRTASTTESSTNTS